MLSSILGNVGARIGGHFGGGVLASAGRYLGNWIGESLEDNFEERTRYHIGRVKNNLYPFSNANSHVIPLIYGTARAEGQLIWATYIKETPQETSTQTFKKDILTTNIRVDFHYSCSFAIGICEGIIHKIERIWANNELLDLGKYNYRIYYGTEDQMPDPLIEATVEGGYVPAHRGLAYIVFQDFPLAEFGNNLPKLSFEVTRYPQYIYHKAYVANKIKGVNIIPGSGEFVYDTIPQTKSHIEMGQNIYTSYFNINNKDNIADSLYSLNYLQNICPNLEWAAPVVCWFGDSLDLASCNIYPAIENEVNPHNIYSEEWRVGGITRSKARLISIDKFGSPNYGGTISDSSVQRYLQELKARGIKIMFYPMIFLDIEGKPWRGWISGNSSEVSNFFNKQYGYNEFIIHYANLCKGLVDAFIIGSEFVGINKIRDGNNFPAVKELIALAGKVKNILGNNVKVTYAADWSEYHHTDGGFYHLDDLWSSPYIDFIGIDNYFPLTRTKCGSPTAEEIREYMQKGEGYDYYFQGNEKHSLAPPYAWKNVKWFYENYHYNPDGTRTSWVPKSKKIWFTEFGFASIDKSTNQPNIFYDPKCVNGGAPIYSNERSNFTIQRDAIAEFIDFWSNEYYVENMFLWCFDARPYPAWPHKKKWKDWHLWEKGHWINGKIGGEILLIDVLLDVMNKCGLDYGLVDFEKMCDSISGICLTKNISGTEFIHLLRTIYFFDQQDKIDGGISLIKRGYGEEVNINSKDFIVNKTDKDFKVMEIDSDFKALLPGSIAIGYIAENELYNSSKEFVRNDNAENNLIQLSLPLVMGSYQARIIGISILKQLRATSHIISFYLPFIYRFLKISDLVSFSLQDKNFKARICLIKYEDMRIFVTCTIEEEVNFDMYD
ncbi:MAG: glycoside hydrolase TIM-barrel-like domain-containing protein [Rickettsiaceae bacterium]|nr:glycoside hydrolase TIM-barrel-like domain-containing protein [Rickettsiaceae bacterium]